MRNERIAASKQGFRRVGIATLVSLAGLAVSPADTLLQWDIATSLPTAPGTTNGSLPINGPGVIGISGTQITVLGTTTTGTASSAGWRWYDGAPRSTDLVGALENSNYFQWSVTTNAFTTATISGLGSTSLSRGAAAPNTLGLVYSTDSAFASYRIVSPSTAISTTAANLAPSLVGDLASNAIVLTPDSTGYFRLAYWGATSGTSGAIWIGNASDGNDFSLTGTFESSLVQRTLTWNGVAETPGSTWNTSPRAAVPLRSPPHWPPALAA